MTSCTLSGHTVSRRRQYGREARARTTAQGCAIEFGRADAASHSGTDWTKPTMVVQVVEAFRIRRLGCAEECLASPAVRASTFCTFGARWDCRTDCRLTTMRPFRAVTRHRASSASLSGCVCMWASNPSLSRSMSLSGTGWSKGAIVCGARASGVADTFAAWRTNRLSNPLVSDRECHPRGGQR